MNEARMFDGLSRRVIGCAIDVHRALGPGLLEGVYQQCLAKELDSRGIRFRMEQSLPVEYRGVKLECGYRVDLLVEGALIVELKAVEEISRLHEAQLLTCMRLARIRSGLLINFNVLRLKDGIRRFVT